MPLDFPMPAVTMTAAGSHDDGHPRSDFQQAFDNFVTWDVVDLGTQHHRIDLWKPLQRHDRLARRISGDHIELGTFQHQLSRGKRPGMLPVKNEKTRSGRHIHFDAARPLINTYDFSNLPQLRPVATDSIPLNLLRGTPH